MRKNHDLYRNIKQIKFGKKQVAVLAVVVLLVGMAAYELTRDNQPQPVADNNSQVVEQEPVEPDEPAPPTEATPPPVSTTTPKPPSPKQPTSQWPVLLSKAQAASLTVVVNKKHKLPSDYAPSLTAVAGGQLRPEAAGAMRSLLDDASAAGVPMKIVSSYRSYQTQVTTYQRWVNLQGQAEADRGSARPGHSEHQTGLTADLDDGSGCNLEACFGKTAAGKWLAANVSNYGFIIRYPEGKEALTGYIYEPWHVRYVGTDIAKAITASGKTMDQYYNVPAGGYN